MSEQNSNESQLIKTIIIEKDCFGDEIETITYTFNRVLHREDGPAKIVRGYRSLLEECYCHGKLHSYNDKPAIYEYRGDHFYKAWYEHGLLHRDGNKPAKIDGCGESYFVRGKYSHSLSFGNEYDEFLANY